MIGIVQGRLSKSSPNNLKTYPKKPESELKIASEIGYNYIEFFPERIFNNDNLIWNRDGRKKYLKITKMKKIVFSGGIERKLPLMQKITAKKLKYNYRICSSLVSSLMGLALIAFSKIKK